MMLTQASGDLISISLSITLNDFLRTLVEAVFVELRAFAGFPGMRAADVAELGFAETATRIPLLVKFSDDNVNSKKRHSRHVIATNPELDETLTLRASLPSILLGESHSLCYSMILHAISVMLSLLAENASLSVTTRTCSDIVILLPLTDVGRAGGHITVRRFWIVEFFLLVGKLISKLMVEETPSVFERHGLSTAAWRVSLLVGHGNAEEVVEAAITVVMLAWHLGAVVGAEVILADDALKLHALLRGLWSFNGERCRADCLIVLQFLNP